MPVPPPTNAAPPPPPPPPYAPPVAPPTQRPWWAFSFTWWSPMLVPVALLTLMVFDLLTKHDGVHRRPVALVFGCLLLLGLIGAPAFASGRRYEQQRRN